MSAPVVAAAAAAIDAPLDMNVRLPKNAEDSIAKLCLSFPTDRPAPWLVRVADVDALIRDFNSHRAHGNENEFKMPAWGRCLFILMFESGKITLGELALRAAVRRDFIKDLFIPGGEARMLKRKGVGNRNKCIRHFIHLSEGVGARILVWLRADVHSQLEAHHFKFALNYNHMHRQTHVFADHNGKVQVATQVPHVPPRAMDEGQRCIAAHAADAELHAPTLTPAEQDFYLSRPHSPLGNLFNLQVCTKSCCVFEDEEFPEMPIATPTEVFNTVDFFTDEWWTWMPAPSTPEQTGMDLFF